MYLRLVEIEASSLRMPCLAKREGATFADTVTLGHQHLSQTRAELGEVLRSMRRSSDRAARASRAKFAGVRRAAIGRMSQALPFVLRRPLLGIHQRWQRWQRDSFRNTTSYREWDQKGPPPRA